MNFWQENKAFVILIGVGIIALGFLWPSLLDLGPTIVSFHRTPYDRTELERRKLKEKLDQYYPTKGQPILVSQALDDVKKANDVLLVNFEEMHHWMSFVARFPFRIPETRQGNERQRYVSLCYTFAQTGELFCKEKMKEKVIEGGKETVIEKEYELALREPTDGVVFLASMRNIKLVDPYFGLRDMAFPEAIKDPDTCLMQIALIHDLGHLAIRLGVDEITSIAPGDPYIWAVKGTNVAKAYPISVHVHCDLPTLLSLLHALDGAHGRVVEAPPPAEEPPSEAPRPVADAAPRGDELLALLKRRAPVQLSIESVTILTEKPMEKPRPGVVKEDQPEPPPRLLVEGTVAEKDAGKEITQAAGMKIVDQFLRGLIEETRLFRDGRVTKYPMFRDAEAPRRFRIVLDKAPPAGAPAEGAKEEKSAPEPKDPAPRKITVQLHGVPSAYVPGAEQVGLKERLTILRPSADDPHDLRFVANAILTRVLEEPKVETRAIEGGGVETHTTQGAKVEALVEPLSEISFPAQEGKPVHNVVRKGDFVSTRFFLVRNLKVRTVEAKVEKDKDGFPTDVVPAHLDVELSVAALRFEKVEMPKAPAPSPETRPQAPAQQPTGPKRPRL